MSHILFDKCNLKIFIVFFKIETKNIHFIRNCIKQNLKDLIEASSFAFLHFFVFHMVKN